MLDKGKEVLDIINNAGGGAEARFVGGCVRDYLLDKNLPGNPDIDTATNLTPDKVTEIFEARKIRVIPTGIDFGTVTVVYELKNYEITTLRNDTQTDGRHAVVSYTNEWQEDAARRDFTFNALYMDVDGKIYDFFNGQQDLKKGIVRFIGNAEERVKEDYLRILRMFRFYAKYGKEKLLKDQLEVVKNLGEGLNIISGERVRSEMLKLLSSPNAKNTVEALEQMLATKILQRITNIDEADFRIKKLKNVYDFEKQPNPIVSLATILCSKIPEDEIDLFSAKWRLSNKEQRFLHRLRESMEIDYSDDYQVRKSLRFNGKDEFYDHIILNYAKGRIKSSQAKKLIKFASEFAVPDFPVSSEDIMRMGVRPSKQLGEILRSAEEIWERSGYKYSKQDILRQLVIK